MFYMKDKNLLDDIRDKSLAELIKLIDNTIKTLENKKDLNDSINEYQKLITLNNFIQKKFQIESKKILEETKQKINKKIQNDKKIK